MKCPTCKEVNLTLAERQGIEIDFCPECRGVWLDRGELDKLIERSLQFAPPADPQDRPQNRVRSSHTQDYPPQHKEHYAHDYRHKPKKSFLAELFD